MSLPVYLKTDPAMPRPSDQQYVLVSQNGLFLCRNHPFFSTDVLINRLPRGVLAGHHRQCRLHCPRLGTAALEYIVGFFHRVYELHRAESIVLIYWDLRRQRYRIQVPEQQAVVAVSPAGGRWPRDVSYTVPLAVPEHWLLLGDLHCHGDLPAYASGIDEEDETHRDGLHGVIGHIDRPVFDVHLELAIDGDRFPLTFGQFFGGFSKRRRFIPQAWLQQVRVIQQPLWPPPRQPPAYRLPGGPWPPGSA